MISDTQNICRPLCLHSITGGNKYVRSPKNRGQPNVCVDSVEYNNNNEQKISSNNKK